MKLENIFESHTTSNEQQLRFSPDMVVGKREWDNSDGETVHGRGEAFTEEYKSKWKLSNGFMVDAMFTIHIDPEYPEEHVELELNVVDSNHDDVWLAENGNVVIDDINSTHRRFYVSVKSNGELNQKVAYIEFDKKNEKCTNVHEYVYGSMDYFLYYCNYIDSVRQEIDDIIGKKRARKREEAFSSLLEDYSCEKVKET